MLEESPESIVALAGEWSSSVTMEIADRILRYFRRLLEWNVRVNLTGARSIADLVGDHLPDSFALSQFVPLGSRVLDVGSGGGLPGIPFSILREDCQVTLLEPRAKRVAFLNTAVREFCCGNATVVRGRLEDFVSLDFGVATSRATFRAQEWFRLGFSVLAPGGRLVLLSTEKFSPGIGDKRLIDWAEYRTASGVMRWAGCFCST
jgi:16S rRNA (guanine527-N7)-methyltransferase